MAAMVDLDTLLGLIICLPRNAANPLAERHEAVLVVQRAHTTILSHI